ncbi:hypothetical protein [Enterobacter hormaechei]|uniref:hypothetical protein n=1 Tax=Enterobacter hormaechei TaxID=158836 RepID=UPI002163A1DA|nr:hypothetical protein [Enterobacter hormaechei]
MTGREAILSCLEKYGHFTAGMAIQESGLTKNQITTASFKMRRDGEIKFSERKGKTIVYVACDDDDDPPQEIKPMNIRDKILNHLESNKPTSAREFHQLTGAPKSRITQLLRELTESGQLEIHSVHNGIKRYRLTELHANRRNAILDWLDSGSEGTSSVISAATGVDLQMTVQILASLSKQGEVYREWLDKGKVWLYRKNAPFTFGCANQMTAFLNKALREVRCERA